MPVIIAYVLVVLIWGTTPLAIRWSAESVDLSFALAARMLIGFVLSYLWMSWRGEKLSFDTGAIKLYSVSLLGTVCAMYGVYWASQYIASGLISVLFGLAPILGGGYAALVLAEKFLTPRRLLGLCCGLLGLAAIFRHELALSGDGWKGVLAILCSVNLYALSSVLIKRYAGAYSSLTVNTGSLAFSLLILIPLWLLSDGHWPAAAGMRSIVAITYLGIFGSFVGFIAYYYILKKLPASTALLVTLITPVIALYLGSALSGEVFGRDALIGSALVMTGLLVYLWPAINELLQLAAARRK